MIPIKTYVNIFNYKEKKKFIFFILLILLNSIFEIMGITAVIPLLGVISDDKFIENYKSFFFLLEGFFQVNQKNIIIFFSIIIIIIFILKNIIFLSFSYFKYKFTYSLLNRFSKDLFISYLKKNYTFFVNKNSSELLRNIQNVGVFTEGVNQLLFILIDMVLLISITLLLISIQTDATIFLLIFSTCIFYILSKLTKNKLKTIGEARQISLKKNIQDIAETFTSIKEVKCFQQESFFINRFYSNLKKYSERSSNYDIIQSLPKIYLELIAVIIFSIITIYISLKENFNLTIPILGLFAASAFRMLPSLNRMLVAVQFFNHYNSLIKNSILEIANNRNQNYERKFKEKFYLKNSIKFENVNFSYGENKILNNINLEIKKNQKIGIIGKTGSGKSTLLNLLLGFLKPETGKILIDDEKPGDLKIKFREIFGFVAQSTMLIDDSIYKNISFKDHKDSSNDNSFWETLRIVDLYDHIKSLKLKEESIVGEGGSKLSGGQIQRLGIARALYNKSEIFIFDEITSSLDENTELKIVESIKKIKNKTMVFVTHRKKLLEICDNVYKLDQGKLNNEKN